MSYVREEENNIPNRGSRKRKKNKRKKLFIHTTIVVTALILITIGVLAYQVKSDLDDMIVPKTPFSETLDPDGPQTETAKEQNEDFYALVIGLDYRENHYALLTDSLMVLHFIPQESIVKLLSIPRDLQVENRSGNLVKINSLFFEGKGLAEREAEKDSSLLTGNTVKLGSLQLDTAVLSAAMANTRNKIEELLDISIDHTTLVNFNTLIELVNEVGGIEIHVDRSMQYDATNLYLEPGLQVLDGEDALGYARFREDNRGPRYFASDFERGQRQQEVVKALAAKILSWGNVPKTLKLLDIVSDNVKTDMGYSDMYSMIKNYYDVFNGDSFISLPFPEYYSADGKNVIIPDDALESLRNDFRSLRDIQTEEVSPN